MYCIFAEGRFEAGTDSSFCNDTTSSTFSIAIVSLAAFASGSTLKMVIDFKIVDALRPIRNEVLLYMSHLMALLFRCV